MTAQIHDSILFEGMNYALAGISGEGLFEPERHGLKPIPIDTACERRFHCRYVIADRLLRLDQLHIGLGEVEARNAARGEGPLLNGKAPRRHVVEGKAYNPKTGGIEPTTWMSSDWHYEDVGIEVPFTGGLLLAEGFIKELYVHMGFHPAWKYRKVQELLLERGALRRAMDRSATMDKVRERMGREPLEPTRTAGRGEIRRWIEACFSRDYPWLEAEGPPEL